MMNNIEQLLNQGEQMAIHEMEEAKAEATKERASVPASNIVEDTEQTNEQTDVQTQDTEQAHDTEREEKSLSKVERLLMQAMEEVEQANEDVEPATEVTEEETDKDDVQTDQTQALTDDMDDIDEEQDSDEQSEEEEQNDTDDEITQLVQALEEERTKIEQERKEFQKQIDEMNKQLKKMEDEKKQAEQSAIKTAISYDLVNRDDVKDPRLLFQLIDTSDIDTTKDINDQVTNKINKVMKKFPSLSTETIPKQIRTNNKDGMTVIDEVRPIGRAMGETKKLPKVTPAKMVKQLKDRAKREGTPQARADYLEKKRELQKKGYRF